ncbi:MAG: carbohydrate ABC transporter permease [Nitriliruptor sp.]|nr:MAG: carbohydrate ABC transporter permease [Nitriliruptor sp.]
MIRLHGAKRWAVLAILVVWLIIVVFPLFWMVTTSIKPQADVYRGGAILPWIDFTPTLDAWIRALLDRARTVRSLTNSAVVGLGSAAVTTLIGGMAGYALSRYQFRFGFMRNRDIAFWLLSNRILPPVVLVLPLFIMFRTIGIVDSRLGLGVLYVMFNLPIAAWLMHEYFKQIPFDLEEAAMVDGAGHLQVFTRIALPLAKPGIIATFLVCLMFAWNEFIYALIFTFTRAQTMPLLVAGQATQHGPQWEAIAVMATITIAPLVVITALLGNRLIEGLVTGWGD